MSNQSDYEFIIDWWAPKCIGVTLGIFFGWWTGFATPLSIGILGCINAFMWFCFYHDWEKVR